MKKVSVMLCAACAMLAGCIENDIPYPRITQNILAIAAEGESKSAYIDSIAFEATVYLEETVDIQNVRFTEYRISPEGTSDPDLLEGTYDLTQPLFVTLSRFQDYNWEIKAVQEIERYFQVKGEVGSSVIDPVGHRVVVNVLEGTDLSNLTLERVKLGPAGITTITPDLKPGPLDLSYPLRVEVECFGRTEIWTIYAQYTEAVVTTTAADAWSRVVWVYGQGPADVKNSIQYRLASSEEWVTVPESLVTQTQGEFYAAIPHLEPLTEYVVRTVSGDNIGNEITVTTQATADIPNGDFENWSQTANGMWNPFPENGEMFWDTGNQGSYAVKVNLTVPSTHTPTGSGYAAECSSKTVGMLGFNKLGAGSIFTGSFVKIEDLSNGFLSFGRPWNLRPTKLKGYFQYKGVDINMAEGDEMKKMLGQPDTCHVYVALTDWTAPYEIHTSPKRRQLFDKNASYVIGYGEMQYSGEMSAYREFEIPITYRSTSRVPTYLQITCSTSKYGDYFTGGSGSVLYIDQLSFDYDLPDP